MTYTFLCYKCNSKFEMQAKITDVVCAVCPTCYSNSNDKFENGEQVIRRIIEQAPNFILKGAGWATDNYSKGR